MRLGFSQQDKQLQEYYNQIGVNVGQEDRGLLEYYNQLSGLQGLASLPSGAANIANQMSGIGTTLGQGIVGSEQSQQASNQQGWGNLMGLAGLFI